MSSSLAKKHILLGITGGIAAYKCAELTRLLSKAGAEVKIVMTTAAKAFVTPLTLQALSGNTVRDSLWDEEAERAMSHIELARWADLILIAPATADCIAKLACGLADDLLTTLCLASTASLFLAPAMNQAMWHHVATQANITTLNTRKVKFIGPEEGSQACGDTGFGRMTEPAAIVATLEAAYATSEAPLKNIHGQSIIITAGPTQESLDPVRYLTNHSSGKMGYALAEAASEAGAQVILISGPTLLDCPPNVTRIDVTSAHEMLTAVMKHIDIANIFIGSAAVSDYSAASISPQKIKKTDKSDRYTLELVKNPDILAQVAALKEKPFVVGFAAETENLLEYAEKKRVNKKLDMIIANSVQSPGLDKQNSCTTGTTGFNSDDNAGWILSANEDPIELTFMSKKEMAKKILATISRMLEPSIL